MHGLGCEHHEIAWPGFARVGRGVDLHRAVARGTFDPQALLAHGLDVLAPPIYRPDLVAGRGEERGVDRAHRARADNGDLHLARFQTTWPVGGPPAEGFGFV